VLFCHVVIIVFACTFVNYTLIKISQSIIRTLTPSACNINEALAHNGKVVTSIREKAALFAQHYASVSRLSFTKKERDKNREAKRFLQIPSVDNISFCDTSSKHHGGSSSHKTDQNHVGCWTGQYFSHVFEGTGPFDD